MQSGDVARFLTKMYPEQPAFSWLAAIHPKTGRCLATPYEYPRQLESAINWYFNNRSDHNLYFCVNPTTSDHGRREVFVEKSKIVYADLDDKCSWEKLLVTPSIVTQTSPSKFQAFWVMENVLPADITSHLSRKIANHHKLDNCWDKVRLMRLPGGMNYKYPEPYEVRIIYEKSALYRPSDFYDYPEPKLIYRDFDKVVDIEGVPKYQDLPESEKRRIDNYTTASISAEMMKLAELAALPEGGRMAYHGLKGLRLMGWEEGTMWVSRCLTEIANAPWNNYSLEQARTDFMTNAPTDLKWTKNDNYAKWESALAKNCGNPIRFREFPQGRV